MDISNTEKYQLNANDQLDKYDLPADKLAEANKKMSEISKRPKKTLEEAKTEIGERSAAKKENARYDRELGAIVSKRTQAEAKEIWDYFLEKHESNFKKRMGYGKQEILKIGYRKFIDAMDWNTKKETGSWLTDALHIIPCPHCKMSFGIAEKRMGLCAKCESLYDVDYVEQLLATMQSINKNNTEKFYASFLTDPKTRKIFRVMTTNQYFKEIGEPSGNGGLNMFGLTCLRNTIHLIRKETVELGLPRDEEKQRYLDYMQKEFLKFDVANRPKLVTFYKVVTEDIDDSIGWEESAQNNLIEKSAGKREVDAVAKE